MSENKPFRARKLFQVRQAGTIFDFFWFLPHWEAENPLSKQNIYFLFFSSQQDKGLRHLAITCCVKGLFNGAADTGSQWLTVSLVNRVLRG